MQAYVARLITKDMPDSDASYKAGYTIEKTYKAGYIVDKVDLLKIVKEFGPETGELLSMVWKVKFVDYEKLDYSYIGEVTQVFPNKESCQEIVNKLNHSLRGYQVSSYSTIDIEMLDEYRKEYQKVVRKNWDNSHTL